MKPFKKMELTDLFWDGSTSLEQEKYLKENASSFSEVEMHYFRYTGAKREGQTKLEADIWDSINHRKKRKLYTAITAAASVALLLAVATYFTLVEKKVKQEQNFALLEETLSHVSIELNSTTTPEVIYTDENLYIVAEN